MDSLTWGDAFRATLGSCLPCIVPTNNSSDHEQAQSSVRTRSLTAREELERLLDEPLADGEAETMSLHSNAGRSRAKKAKRRNRKALRVFGIDLFGRRPIQSSIDDEDEDFSSALGGEGGRIRAISTSTLDSDAAPLGDEAITDFTARAHSRWAPSQTDQELAAEEAAEHERVEKELRKERKRKRKEMKRLEELEAFNGGSGEFEGFPGSGNAPPTVDEFGPFVGHQSSENNGHKEKEIEDNDEEEADFDAAAYTKKRRDGGSASGSGGTHSRSHSRTSASLSVDGTKSHTRDGRISSKSRSTKSPSSLDEPTRTGSNPQKNTFERAKSKRSKSSAASSSATHSLPSPALQPSPDIKIRGADFDGVPGGLVAPPSDSLPTALNATSFPSTGLPSTGFPSTGFGKSKRSTSGGLSSIAGVALARRGDD